MCHVLRVSFLVCIIAAGCAEPEPARSTSWFGHAHTSTAPADIVQIDVALLERPLGDAFLNHELWEHTDEQVVPVEQRTLLDDNGFRIGQIVGIPPARLQELLDSERSCISKRRRLAPSGRSIDQVLSVSQPHVAFQMKENENTTDVEFDNAQFVLEIVSTLTGDGRTQLHFTPKVQYGENVPDLSPAKDACEWSYQISRPSKAYHDLSYTVALAPNEFLLIGARTSQPQSLGYQAFVQDRDAGVGQRLVVIRTNRPAADSSAGAGPSSADPCPPLAAQAGAGR